MVYGADGATQNIELERLPSDHVATVTGNMETRFVGRVPALLDSVHYQVLLGDAWTNLAAITMVPRPQVEVQLLVEPPAYAQFSHDQIPAPGSLRADVLEGSRVTLNVVCTNGKRLRRVLADLYAPAGHERHALQAVGNDAAHWRLDSSASKLLQNMREHVRFELSVTDQDGMLPPRLPSGEVRVHADLPPFATVATIHQLVLPDARPTLTYRVTDDFGIRQLRMKVEIARDKQKRDSPDSGEGDWEQRFVELNEVANPLPASRLPYTGHVVLDLSTWQLQKGDRLKLSLEATDDRGQGAVPRR